MYAACFGASCAALALAAGIEVGEIEGLTGPLLFACWSHAPRIYLPPGWTGPIRDAAICAAYSALVGAVVPTAQREANWRANVARVTDPAVWAYAEVEAAG